MNDRNDSHSDLHSDSNSDSNLDRLNQATAARLATLASRPVDMSQLNGHLDQTLRENKIQATTTLTRPWAWTQSWRSITTAVAALVILTVVGWFLLDGGPSPILARPINLAQIHFEVANGLSPHLKVSTVAEANQRLAQQSEGITPLPDLPNNLKSCCLHRYGDTTLTCALIERDGQLITIAIAASQKFHSPKGNTINRNGRQFIAHSANGINMVMTHEADRWLCVMGQNIPINRLIDVAVEIDLK